MKLEHCEGIANRKVGSRLVCGSASGGITVFRKNSKVPISEIRA